MMSKLKWSQLLWDWHSLRHILKERVELVTWTQSKQETSEKEKDIRKEK